MRLPAFIDGTSLQFAAALGRTQMMNTVGRSQAGESKPSGRSLRLAREAGNNGRSTDAVMPMTADISPALTGL
jgi:hypothetical protein